MNPAMVPKGMVPIRIEIKTTKKSEARLCREGEHRTTAKMSLSLFWRNRGWLVYEGLETPKDLKSDTGGELSGRNAESVFP